MNMQFINQIIGQNLLYIVTGVIILILAIIAMLLAFNKKLSKLNKRYEKIMQGDDFTSFEAVVADCREKNAKLIARVAQLEKEKVLMEEKLAISLKNISLVRYNAFNDMGSDLSFSIAMLDDHKNGFLLTSLYGREESRTYAKPINNGNSTYRLTEEEKSVLAEALRKIN